MVRWNFTNTADWTTLASFLAAGATSITLTDASTWPASDFKLQLDDEVIDIQSRSGNVLTVRTGGRGYDGTSDTTHNAGALAKMVVTAEDYLSRFLGYPITEPGAPEDGLVVSWDDSGQAFVFIAGGGGAAPEEYWREALLGGM